MTKREYRAAIRAHKRLKKPGIRLIHLLINYRSYKPGYYPYGFKSIMDQIKNGQKLFDHDGLRIFYNLEGFDFNQPNFSRVKFDRTRTNVETDYPF